MNGGFSGKTILVTGASSGLGEACAAYLDKQGAQLVLVARNERKLDMMVSSFNKAIALPGDFYNPSCVDGIFAQIDNKQLCLDGVVHCAGIAPDIPVSQYSYDEALGIFNVNFFSFCSIIKYCSRKKYMNRGGSIVAISSLSVLRGNKAQASYVASKSALEGYVGIAAKELLEKQIRVNAVAPGALDTPMTDRAFTASPMAKENINSVQRLGLIDTTVLARLIGFLLSDDACYMTGLTIPVDAGSLLSTGI